MSERNVPARREISAVLRYGLAVASVAVAVLATLSLGPNALMSPLFFLAVIVSAWFGGGRPGLLAAVLASLALAYFFLPPLYDLRVDPPNRAPLLLFVLSAVFVSWLSAVANRTLVQLQQARDELETRVQERTAELRERADRLRESEKRYRYIFESTGVSIWEQDFSRVKAAIDDLRSRGVQDFRAYLAEHMEFVRRAITMVKVSDVNDATVKLFAAKSKDELMTSLGSIFLPETEEVFRRELIAVAEGGTYFESETVLQTLERDRLTVLFTITFPPPPSRLDRVLVTITDITQRKRAEEALQKAEAELAHVTRVTTLGELAASIAHEVNQPLAAIVADANACLNWLARANPDLDRVRDAIAAIVNDGHRAADVVQRIRQLATKTEPHKTRLEVNDVVRDVLLLVRSELRQHEVTLAVELAPGLPPVLGDRVQLQQVILNLVMNGIEAMAAVGDRPRALLIRCEAHEPGAVAVAVRDCGVGLDPPGADRIFDAFYTTKVDGLGMGLSISRSIIEAHGGRLWATANDDHGVTFQFTLPTNGADRA